jgi:hyaluronan synthase
MMDRENATDGVIVACASHTPRTPHVDDQSPCKTPTAQPDDIGTDDRPTLSLNEFEDSMNARTGKPAPISLPRLPSKSKFLSAEYAKSKGADLTNFGLKTPTSQSMEQQGMPKKSLTGGYPGYGCSIPAGPKRYAENLQTPEPGRCLHYRGQKGLRVLLPLCRIIFTLAVAVGCLGVITYAYFKGETLVRDNHYYLGFGLYGAVLFAHVLLQALFASLEHRKMRLLAESPEQKKMFDSNAGMSTQQVRSLSDGAGAAGVSTVALQISAFEEDPDYLRECLTSISKLRYPSSKLKIVLTVDGNQDKDLYHWEIFKEIFATDDPKLFRWDYNFHELPEALGDDSNGVDDLMGLLRSNRCICIMQKWGGKREVMYTAFKAIGDAVDYMQVCDSDTKLHANATLELVRVLDAQPHVGAVGGDVRILNDGDSIVSFLSSLRYWMAFNVERACQSYFGCVSCISGPLGLYRNSVLQQYLNLWSDQKFLGSVCTFGDDRHLTNRMLQFGCATKYTPYAVCHTETPSHYMRWLNQQIRWSKSYFREWLFNALWWHKHHPWMTYESIVAGFFPYFVTGTVIVNMWSGDIWKIIWILCTIQVMGLLKGLFSSILRRDPIMLFMSMYGVFYMTSLLPGKYFAMVTINKKSWGTSGRKTLLKNYNALIPLVVWACILLPGVVYSTTKEILNNKGTGMPRTKIIYLSAAFGSYLVYWAIVYICWRCCVQQRLNKKADLIREENEYGERTAASKSWATAIHATHNDPTGTWKM